jgi:hypothetical protein
MEDLTAKKKKTNILLIVPRDGALVEEVEGK